jgi:hypothetical protein
VIALIIPLLVMATMAHMGIDPSRHRMLSALTLWVVTFLCLYLVELGLLMATR